MRKRIQWFLSQGHRASERKQEHRSVTLRPCQIFQFSEARFPAYNLGSLRPLPSTWDPDRIALNPIHCLPRPPQASPGSLLSPGFTFSGPSPCLLILSYLPMTPRAHSSAPPPHTASREKPTGSRQSTAERYWQRTGGGWRGWWGEVKWCLLPSGYHPCPPLHHMLPPGLRSQGAPQDLPHPVTHHTSLPARSLVPRAEILLHPFITHQWWWTKSLPSGSLYFSSRKRGKSNKQVTTAWVRWWGANICGFGVIPSIHAPPPTSQCLHRDGTSQVAQWQRICHCRRHRRCRFDPWIWKIPWRRK